MELPQNPVGQYEAAVATVASRQDPAGLLPYFDMQDAESAELVVEFEDGTVETFVAEVVSSEAVEGGSQAVLRYVPSDGDFPDLETARAYFRVVGPGGPISTKPFPLNLVRRF